MLQIFDRVAVFTSTTGTTDVAIGAAVPSFRGFNGVVPDGANFPYLLLDNTTQEFEIGVGVYIASTQKVVRSNTVISSTGLPIVLSGDAQMSITAPASYLSTLDDKSGGTVEGDISVEGSLLAIQSLSVGGDISLAGSLSGSDASLTGGLAVAGNASAAQVTTTGNTSIGGALAVTGNTTLAGSLSGSDASLTGGLAVAGNANVDGSIQVAGDATIGIAATAQRLYLVQEFSDNVGPELDFWGKNGQWLMGIDVANNGGSKDFVLLGRRDQFNGDANDLIYISHNGIQHATTTAPASSSEVILVDDTAGILPGMVVRGAGIVGNPTVLNVESSTQVNLSEPQSINAFTNLIFENFPTIGLGYTPPEKGTFRVQIAAADSEPGMGGLGIRIGPTQTANAFHIFNSAGTMVWSIDRLGYASKTIVRDSVTSDRLLGFVKSDYTVGYSYRYSGNNMVFRYDTGGIDLIHYRTDGRIDVIGSLTVAKTIRLGSFTVGGLPTAAAALAGTQAYITNGSRPNRPCYCNGTAWRYFSDDAIVN